ncbi:uncharacterized protein RB166_016589 [Leptodactylus fuscus]|uniref:uncharacterized protein LOC142217638 n=1 Tax=Leptodactylus fuscus TaxID=238119 RepID=UPI003F4F16CB
MLLLLVTALLIQDSESQGDLKAQIQMASTTGSISINTNTFILWTNLTGSCGPVSISIHEFPVVHGESRDPCDEEFIGRPCYNVTMGGVGEMVIDSKIRYGGRSLALETCGQKTCVNLQDSSQRTWQAKLNSFIIGQVYFLQSQNMMVGLLDLAMLEEIPTLNTSLLFSSTCHLDDGLVFGSIEPGSEKKFVKSRLELSDVTIMPFLLVKYNERWTCTEVKTVTSKEASAPISMLGINGSFTFRQESPFSPTHIAINLERLHGHAGHYRIHSLPVLPRQEPGQDLCATEDIGKLWDPLDVTSQFSSPQGAHSSWPLGDLSGRHGTLQDQKNFKTELIDWNLPVFGNNSIIGRSIVISRTSGEAWACSTIRLGGEAMKATAIFRKGVIGRVMFQQALGDPYSDLSIYVELSHGSDNISQGHNWHIHQFLLQTESESCTNAGGHFNPYNVPINAKYSDECNPWHPLRCEAGDYASKHQPISFSRANPTRHVFTDTSTSLSGPNSIIGRSMVVHGADGAATRIACANILLHRNSEGRTGAWFGFGNAHGELRASQVSELDPTFVQFSFHDLRGLAGGFHIHLLPVTGALDEPCSNALIQGHFNPFSINISTSPVAGNGTDDEYEVGDISGRQGLLTNQDNVTKQYMDMNFPMSGRHSILGRSLVIHYANGSRMQCTRFLQDLPLDGEWVRATAEFSGHLNGRISLSQIVYPDGGSSDTTVLVDLRSSSSTPGKTIEWLIRTQERGAEPYNPYDVPSQTGDLCTRRSPQLCRVGDLTGKHGPVTAEQKVLVTDPNLPLTGDYTVIGRPLTVTLDALELSSLIIPDVPITTLYFQRMTSLNRSAFRESLSIALNVTPWKVIFLPDSPNNNTTCQGLTFYIIGYNDTGALASIHTQDSLGRPCLTPSESLESSAGRDLRTMAAYWVMVSLILLLW